MRSTTETTRFAICVSARPEEDLVVGKVYRVLLDKSATEVGCLRVVDESGEDYLYAAKRFVPVSVREAQRARLLRAVQRKAV